jgi:hypothetical protein
MNLGLVGVRFIEPGSFLTSKSKAGRDESRPYARAQIRSGFRRVSLSRPPLNARSRASTFFLREKESRLA